MRRHSHIILYGMDEVERSILHCVIGARLEAKTICYEDEERCLDFILSRHVAGQTDVRCVVVVHTGRSQKFKDGTLIFLGKMHRRFPKIPVLLLDLPSNLHEAVVNRRFSGLTKPADILEAITAVWRLPTPEAAPLNVTAQKAAAVVKAPRLERMMELAGRMHA